MDWGLGRVRCLAKDHLFGLFCSVHVSSLMRKDSKWWHKRHKLWLKSREKEWMRRKRVKVEGECDREWIKMWLNEQSHYSFSLGFCITTIKTYNIWKMTMNKLSFFFFCWNKWKTQARDDVHGLKAKWITTGWKVLIWPYFVCEAMRGRRCWNKAPSTRWSNTAAAPEGKTWRATNEAGS